MRATTAYKLHGTNLPAAEMVARRKPVRCDVIRFAINLFPPSLFSLSLKQLAWTCRSLCLCSSVSPASSVPTSIPRAVYSENSIAILMAFVYKLQSLATTPHRDYPCSHSSHSGPFFFFSIPIFLSLSLTSSTLPSFLPGMHAAGVPRRKKEKEGLARIGGSSPIGWPVCHHYVRRTTSRLRMLR